MNFLVSAALIPLLGPATLPNVVLDLTAQSALFPQLPKGREVNGRSGMVRVDHRIRLEVVEQSGRWEEERRVVQVGSRLHGDRQLH